MGAGLSTKRAERALHLWLLPCHTPPSEQGEPSGPTHSIPQLVGSGPAGPWEKTQSSYAVTAQSLECGPGGAVAAIFSAYSSGTRNQHASVPLPEDQTLWPHPLHATARFRIETEIKNFSGKQKLKEFSNINLPYKKY